MKNILLPTDFSDNSINAIEYASQLFKEIPCKFYLLNVFKIPYLANEELMDQNVAELAALEEEMYDNSKLEMEKLLELLPTNKFHEFKTISDYNLFNLAVHQVVEEKNIELIIMGTKGATGAKEIFMGSNTGDVVMRSSCNVIAVPEKHSFKTPKEIVFPTDFQIEYDLEDLAPLISLAEMNGSSIRIVHFSEQTDLDQIQEENKRKLSSFLVNVPHEYFTLSSSDFVEGLNCFAQSRGNIDMIVIIGRHYGFFQRLFFKPKVRSLSFHTNIPLFVIHHINE
ncbi:MAG: universal stress protein [Flavobacteriales bacterium]|nr:universal stress protein [Flavobacteriales bacterium]